MDRGVNHNRRRLSREKMVNATVNHGAATKRISPMQ